MARTYEWYRFDSCTTVAESFKIPFDLLYLIPKDDVRQFEKTYPIFLVIEPSQMFWDALAERNLNEYHESKPNRNDNTDKTFLTAVKVKEYFDFSKAESYLACVPILPRKKGDKVTLSYVATYHQVNEISTKYRKKTYRHTIDQTIAEKTLSSLHVNLQGKQIIPCSICTQAIKKVMDDGYCHLGTESCLEKICLKGIECFEDKIRKGVPPPELPQEDNYGERIQEEPPHENHV